MRTHLHDYRCNLSEVVCIDEIDTSIGEDKYSFVIGDPINSIILDILPSRKQDYLIYYFQTLSPENKANVKYIISDLYGPYKLFLQATFPNAIHIADRFHYLNVVKKALEKTRIRIMKKYEQYKGCWKTDPENYNKYYVLKHYGDLLFINPFSDLNKYTLSELIYDKGNKNVTKQKKIEEMVNIDPILEESYLLLKNFYHLDRFSTIKDIHDKLLNWIKSVYDSIYDIKEMKSAASTISDWKNEIANSFIFNPITHSRMTNGFIEGKNRYIDTLKWISFGFKDFDTLRYKIINYQNHNKK